ncbi:MAG: hypothetical protein ACRD1Z_23185, partial [Vicinamibacteria bacterium]
MKRTRSLTTVAISTIGAGLWAIVLAAGIPGGAAATAESVAMSAPASFWQKWSSLRFQARPLFLFSGRVEMKLREEAGRRMIETETRATFLGVELASSRSQTTIDAATGRTLEYWDLSKSRGRRYTFAETGYSVERLRPKNGPDAPVTQWEVTSRRQFAYPAPPAEGAPAPPVFDFYGMILHLRKAPLEKPGDEVTLWVATTRGAKPFRISVGEVRQSHRVFLDLATGRSRTEPVREFRLRISPADPAASEEGFLKMEGDTEIWVESESRTLLEIEGKIPKVPG